MTTFRTALEAALSEFGVDALAETQGEQIARHYELLLKWNRRINLTRIIEPEAAARLHYAESLAGARFIGPGTSLLDAGSGAGFPAIPLAVARPDLAVTALEANRRKSLFLNEVKAELELANFKVVTARLESFDWSSYDWIATRALDRAEPMLRMVIKQLRSSQRLMLYCGRELLGALTEPADHGLSVEVHQLPLSELRLIAIISRRS